MIVRHQRVRGWAAMASPRDRQSPASRGPNPGTSPGDCDTPSHVPSGTVKLTIPASARPLCRPEPGSGCEPGVETEPGVHCEPGVETEPGVHREPQVETEPGG